MNYRLSCATDRVGKKNGYVLEKQGIELCSSFFKPVNDNIKDNILETVYRGLKSAGLYVSHDDILLIEIQNMHLFNWLSGLVEYKGYEGYLDKVFEVLEGIDCRYRFVFEKRPYAKMLFSSRDYDKIKGSGFLDVMKGLGGEDNEEH